ncbi:MAG: hypothetical protein IPM29_27200 [Planctomycetes bacterium]|nr:hypothetical protein [Planctomycetota bacterium]
MTSPVIRSTMLASHSGARLQRMRAAFGCSPSAAAISWKVAPSKRLRFTILRS